jgi:hypothetical protein
MLQAIRAVTGPKGCLLVVTVLAFTTIFHVLQISVK